MHLRRIGFLSAILALASPALAQQNFPPPGGYHPIPNFIGQDAGLDFRNAINDRLSGTEAIAPRLGAVPFASLGPEQDGSQLYCTDCNATLPCSAGGSGALASGVNGQWQCNMPIVPLKLDGTDTLPPLNGTRTNEKNILDFGAVPSVARINCSTVGGQQNITCTGVGSSDFAINDYVALYGAGAAPTVAQPTGFTVQPATTTNSPSSATQFTRFAQGCTVQNALAWCTAGSSICSLSNVAFYEQGQTVTIAGAGAGDGLGVAMTPTRPTLRDIYTGQASVGVRFANINQGNVEFGVVESSIINWVYGQTRVSSSNIGCLINSGNSLATRFDGSTITGNIGIWSDTAGFSALQTQFGQVDGISVFLGASYGHPVTLDTSRMEHAARGVYNPGVGGTTGTQVTLRGNTFADIRLPTDGAFIALAGGQAAVLDGNEFFLSQWGTNNDFATDQFPNGIIIQGQAGGVEARGNFWSNICGDPYALIPAVDASGDVCTASDGSLHHIAPYSRGQGGFRIGSPTGGPMGEGSLNLGGPLFTNGQPLVNWGETSISSIAASGTASATVNWNTAFGDSNYDFSCIVVDGAGFLSVSGASTKTATAVGFAVKNNDSSAAHSGTANCIAVHH